MNDGIKRRTITNAAWMAPVVSIAVSAPAFATSVAGECKPLAKCKLPGEGSFSKDYAIDPQCTAGTGTVLQVRVYDDKEEVWITAVYEVNPDTGVGEWIARGFNDSRRNRTVEITTTGLGVTLYTIPFPPC